jgi:probable DNA repair protein
LQLLELYRKKIPIDMFSYLLVSPFIGEAESERLKRANIDRSLRQNNITHVHLEKMLDPTNNHAVQMIAKQSKDLTKRIQHYLQILDSLPKELSYNAWATQFHEMLTCLGWPGERSLSSDEYQIIEAWLNLLSEFTTLDHIAKPVSLYEALRTLKKMCTSTVFQPKTPEAPIQVLGLLEAAALPFDYLWVAGMDDVSWPPQPKPNPFIPKRLQRELKMPHATAERELAFCSTITSQFKRSAAAAIFSHIEKNKELELQPSPLIRDLAEMNVTQLHLAPYDSPCERIYQSKMLAYLADEQAPAIKPHSEVRGGVSIIKQQALCPFKSFAEWRLHAREIESPLPGMRSKDRGTLIHKVIELIWRKLKDQAALLAMPDAALTSFIQECIQEALDAFPHAHKEYKQYMALEMQRMNQLIHDWLSIEKQRPPFKVLANEEAEQITLDQLTLSIRIDRVDELSDGNKLIIDYKTSKNNNINDWFNVRPSEPQLPLYALLHPEQSVGITFAQLTRGETAFKGVSHYSLDIEGIKTINDIKVTELSWPDQLSQWRSVISQLSRDFYEGKAIVDPKDPHETCAWCALKSLCRISEDRVPA